ncbi:MAG: class C sortase, partial [Lachnospiraceae bacterium]|nr:class C sortase [Lachnospiraceae bacterium]
MKESVRKVLMFIMGLGFLIGLALLIYPLFSNMWNQYNDKLKFQEYQMVINEKTGDEGLVDEWEKAHQYNDELQPIIIPDSFIQAEANVDKEENEKYMSCLNVDGDGVMGYISIPKIGEIIPIYHTATEA